MDLTKLLQEEKYIMPNYQEDVHFLDLVKVIYNYCGCHFKENQKMQEIKKVFPNKKHIVLILVDGMGVHTLNHLPGKSLFKDNIKKNLRAIFPTATGCVLTSLTTAKFPCQTGIYGWYGYHRKKNLNYFSLLGKERRTKEDLESINDLYIYPSIMNKLKRRTLVLQPSNIFDSLYSNYIVDKNKKDGYDDYFDAMDKIKKEITSDNKTFTYLYIPTVDTLEHHNGPFTPIVYDEIKKIEEALKTIINYDDTVIVVTADHGQLPINETIYMDLNKYDKYFYACPGIDMGTTTFYIKEKMEEDFIKEFNIDFKNMCLFKTDEFVKQNIFGGKLDGYARSCLGEYIGISKRGYAFYADYEKKEELPKGNHSGMSSEEFTIPLIVIKKEE